jgi:hypothetical protein
MGNVLRVLGIVLASMLLGLTGLFLLLFTICGGLTGSDGGGIMAVCLVLMVGAVGLIVFLGRGIVVVRAASRGLAVPPAGTTPVYGDAAAYGASSASSAEATSTDGGPMITPSPAASVPQARPVLPLRPFTGTDLQALVAVRIGLAIYLLLSVGSMLVTLANFSRFGNSVGIHLILRNILTVLPPIVALVAVSVRNPPAGAALDAVAGFGIASIIFRFAYSAFTMFTPAFRQADILMTMLPRLAGYSLLDAGIAGLALYLRSRVGPIKAATLTVATLAFLFWEGLVQAIMTALISVLY